jgi:peptide/nickel transport system ATP-binding protein
MSEKLLDVENLKVEYKTDYDVIKAVNGLTFSLNRKENLGIVGETGAGKTTSALSILRLLPKGIGHITNGRISFNGQSILDMTEEEMRSIRGDKISMIFQDPMTSLNPVLTVEQQIAEVLEIHNDGMASKESIKNRVNEMLERVGIPAQRKKEYPHQFSGGMKQRVVIAMALACNPELLIADEPTTALDVTIQAQILDMMNGLKETLDTAMILITHDLGVVAQMCDHVAIVYAGEIIEYGTVEDIFESDRHHPYTVGLFASIPNISEETSRLKPIAGLMPDPTDLPDGCKFHPRCSKCMQICRTEEPQYNIIEEQRIKCHLFNR